MKRILSYVVILTVLLSVMLSSGSSVLARTVISKGKLKKLTYNSTKKTIKVSWTKRKVKGYQIKYATNAKFKNSKIINIRKAKTVSKTVKKIKKNKTYYFTIRCYKTVKGKKKYGKFSAVKKISTKIKKKPVTTPESKPETENENVIDKNYVENPAQALDMKTVGDKMKSNITMFDYTLKFIDDFNGTTLNANNWAFEEVNSNGSEIQKNVIENIEVANGALNLYGKKIDNPDGTTSFTGTKVTSHYLQEFKYGRLEARIIMPYGKGTFPAWWTLGTLDGWPWGGEIDIMEFTGGSGKYANCGFNSGIHWCDPDVVGDSAYGHEHKTEGIPFAILDFMSGEKLADRWHVFGVEWTQTRLYFYFDGTMFNEIDISGYSYSRAFHQPHFMILNFAFGGQAGTPDATTVFPQVMQVDWVKVWQR